MEIVNDEVILKQKIANAGQTKDKDGKKLVLIDFFASWCGPCSMLSPVLEAYSKEHSDVLEVYKINVDEAPEISAQYNVSALPTLILLKDGKETQRSVGYKPIEMLNSTFKEVQELENKE